MGLVYDYVCLLLELFTFSKVLTKLTDGTTLLLLQLLRIEEELGSAAVYAGAKFRVPVEPY